MSRKKEAVAAAEAPVEEEQATPPEAANDAEQPKEDAGPDFSHFVASQLSADMAKAMLEWFQHAPKPWQTMTQAEQSYLIGNITRQAEHIVKRGVYLIAQEGRITVRGLIKKIMVASEVQAVLTLPFTSPHVLDLVKSQGKEVQVVVYDADEFMGDTSAIRPDGPRGDQIDLPLDGEDGEDESVFDKTDTGESVSAERADRTAGDIDDLLPKDPPAAA